MPTKTWKNLEYKLTKDLKEAGMKSSFRVPLSGSSRMIKGDVQAKNGEKLIADCKRRKQLAVDTWFQKLKEEAKPDQIPILVLKKHNQRGYYVVLERGFFLELIRRSVAND